MADPNRMTTTIDEYLLSLADGIVYAQQRLNQTSVAGVGGQALTYHLPKLDFELKMTLDFAKSPAVTARFAASRLRSASDSHVMVRPVTAAETGAASFKPEIISTVRGSFVAVPPNEGRPAVRLRASIEEMSVREVRLQVEARSALGEPVAGLEIEFNVDRDQSAALSVAADVTLPGTPRGLHPRTGFRQGVVSTDAKGMAPNVLSINENETAGARIAVTIDALNRTEVLVHTYRR